MADSIKSGMHVFFLSLGACHLATPTVCDAGRLRARIRKSTPRGVTVVPPREATSAQRGVTRWPGLWIAYPALSGVYSVPVDRGSADRHMVQLTACLPLHGRLSDISAHMGRT